MNRFIPILFALSALIGLEQSSFATPCEQFNTEIPIERSVANASAWANLRNARGSLRFETGRIISAADEHVAKAQEPANLCPSHCALPNKPEIIFRSLPNEVKQDYSDEAHCGELLRKTQKQPFAYSDRSFKNLSSLNSWFGDLSRGKGKDGRDLYEKCNASCSPNYTTVINKLDKEYKVNIHVVCGHARDKSDNQYELNAAYRWTCQPLDTTNSQVASSVPASQL